MNQRALVKIGLLIILNMTYILVNVLSLGLLLLPSTSALFNFIYKIRRNSNEHFEIVKPFILKTFEKTKKLFLVIIIMYVLFFTILFNYENIELLNYHVTIKQLLTVIYLVFMGEIILNLIMAAQLSSIYEFKSNKDLLKMSFFITHRHIISTFILIVVLLTVGYLIIISTWIVIFFGLFSFLCYLMWGLYLPIFEKYIIKDESEHGKSN
ncbi:hypothetical protein [Acholeplasma granularum]|uniref:hypothetical protein n=1 Tax=Acholeplasma granularum TaxID=264635 RepID=UPI00046EDF76|nr:hypothetical protein [Acholeplasma granularum]